MEQEDYIKLLEQGRHAEIIKACEPLVYKQLHKTKFWNMFPQDREDMLQVGRMAIWKCIQTYIPGKAKFTTFVYVVVRNKLQDYATEMKLFKNKSVIPLDFEVGLVDKSLDLNYLAVLEYIDGYRHQDIVSDYYIYGMSQKDVAKKRGVKQQWVSYVITRFRKNIKIDLGED